MSIQYTLAFVCLVAEVGIFVLLSIPFGHKQKHQIIHAVTASPAFRPIKTFLTVLGFLILILFLDALNRAVLNPPGKMQDPHGTPLQEQAVNAKKFYAQRNLYLTGSTLVMFYATTSYYNLMLTYLRTKAKLETRQREVETLQNQVKSQSVAEAPAVKPDGPAKASPLVKGEEIELASGLRKRN